MSATPHKHRPVLSLRRAFPATTWPRGITRRKDACSCGARRDSEHSLHGSVYGRWQNTQDRKVSMSVMVNHWPRGKWGYGEALCYGSGEAPRFEDVTVVHLAGGNFRDDAVCFDCGRVVELETEVCS